jgi:hypothetical protein
VIGPFAVADAQPAVAVRLELEAVPALAGRDRLLREQVDERRGAVDRERHRRRPVEKVVQRDRRAPWKS